MRFMRKFVAVLAAFSLLSNAVNAATVLVNEGKVDTRTEALASNASRLTTKGYNPTWPGTHLGSHYSGVTAPWAYAGADSLEKVFGSECDDLLYTDPNSVYSVEEMLMDEQKGLSTYDITEWNGYLFVLCGGNKVKYYTDRSEYFQYGNGKTVTYDGCERSDSSGKDSYLYVFDISRGEHYGKALAAKWHITDLGLGGLSNAPNQIMSDIAVDDDYIYITLNNGAISSSVGTAADQYDKFLAVFENNFDRENPDYIEGTDILKTPKRAEDPASVAEYTYGAKQIYDHSAIGVASNVDYTTAAINGTHIMWYEQNYSMAATTSKLDSMFYVTEVVKNGEYAEIKDTKIHYGLEKNLALANSSTAPITSILQYEQGAAWSETVNPTLNSVVNDGNLMYILVSYGKAEGGGIKCYHRIYVTDWSSPLTPKNLSMYEWEDAAYSALMSGGQSLTVADYLYFYDGYLYVSGDCGITILSLKDDKGEYNIGYVSYIPYDEETTGVVKKAYIVAIGNYLVLWSGYDFHWGAEAQLLLNEDKTAVKTLAFYGTRFRQHTGITGNAVKIYGNRAYIPVSPHATGFALTGMVEVINFEAAAPIELSVKPVGDVVTVPYKISGKAFGLNSVMLNINGEEIYVPTTAGEGNYKVWEYEITEPGKYEIDAVGAVLKGFPNEGTKEHLSFTATVGGEADYGAEIREEVQPDDSAVLTVRPYLRNNNFSGSIEAVPAVAAYSGTTLIAMVKGNKTLIEAGQDIDFDEIKVDIPSDYAEYSVKLFLLGGVEDITPLTPAVTLKTK